MLDARRRMSSGFRGVLIALLWKGDCAREESDVACRQQLQEGTSHEVVFRQQPPHTRVGTPRTVVAHDKVLVRPHTDNLAADGAFPVGP